MPIMQQAPKQKEELLMIQIDISVASSSDYSEVRINY